MTSLLHGQRQAHPLRSGVAAALLAGALAPVAADADRSDKDRRPSLSLRASPAVSFSPARVYLVAELKGGANDYEEYYCASVEWDWGDGTKSEATYDCEPYEPGKSEIKRRFAVEHRFTTAGSYRVQFRLKRNDRVVASTGVTVQVRPGVRDIGS